MKKTLFTCLIIVLAATLISADTTASKKFNLSPAAQQDMFFESGYGYGGIKLLGGLAFSNIGYSRDPGVGIDQYQSSKMGFLGGIGFEMGSRIAFEIDVMYMQKGVKFKGEGSDATSGYNGSFDVKAYFDEVSVPVLIKLRLMPGSTPYILGGGEIAYMVSTKADYDVTDGDTGQSYSGTEDLGDAENLNKLDYGAVFGAGFEMNTGSIPFFVEGRYYLGMANLFKNTDTTPSGVQDDDWVRTRAIVVLIGAKF